jgi:hypothetical protein
MHYESYIRALRRRFRHDNPLPRSPLIVDFGCGPGTTALALADWYREHGCHRANVSFIGIDNSRPLREIAMDMLSGGGVFGHGSTLLLRPSVAELTERDVERAARGHDGVIFALSYILHQRFMRNMDDLVTLMRRIRAKTAGLRTWFLLQDANFQETYGAVTVVWPESRVNALADRCRELGYRIRGFGAKEIFKSPHVWISNDGRFEVEETGETSNVCSFFQKIA